MNTMEDINDHSPREAAPEPSAESDPQQSSTDDQGSSSEHSSSRPAVSEGEFFDCNICLDAAQDPVVTMCGHLFCWGCIYKWLMTPTRANVCPVCKSGISKEKCIPIYGRGRAENDPRNRIPTNSEPVPERPAGQRSQAQPNPHHIPHPFHEIPGFAHTMHPFTFHVSTHSFFASLFGISMFPQTTGPITPEQQQQLNFSRFLLTIGSLVVMFLLFME